MHDVVTQTRIFDLDGKQVRTDHVSNAGRRFACQSDAKIREGFYTFESFNIPPTIYHYDVQSGKTDVFARPKVPFDSDEYEVKQVFYKSKDGTRVPMFISSKKGLKRDGKSPDADVRVWRVQCEPRRRTGIPNTPGGWSRADFIAQPNLRGGGEYGEAWHKAGMFEKKQNVFDDFFAAARIPDRQQYTSPEHLRDPRTLQRRPADGRGHDPAS